jgi:hypothetical protein
LGHATTVVTQHYVGQLTVEQSKEINSCLYWLFYFSELKTVIAIKVSKEYLL